MENMFKNTDVLTNLPHWYNFEYTFYK